LSEGRRNQNKERTEVKTFPVPFASGVIEENITIKTNTFNKISKEQIINQALKIHSQGKILEAAKSYQQIINQGYNDHRIFSNYGVILKNHGQLKEAELSIRKAIDLDPYQANAHNNLGLILKDLGKLQDAELSYRKAIEINPDFAGAYSNLGNILRDLGSLQDAELSCRKAIELNPDYAGSHSNLGNVLKDLGKLQDAELSYRKAIEINPDYANAHSNLGIILNELGNFNEAINHYKKALKVNDKLSIAKAGLITSKGAICDWSDQNIQTIWLKNLGIEESSVPPFDLLHYQDNPLNHLKRSQNYYKELYSRSENSIPLSNNKKIHIGYFSADFNQHPVMILLSSILELHDKSKFKIYLYSFGQKEDEYTERVRKSGCIFRNIYKLNDVETIALARDDQIDIAVDLMGYTRNHRISIFSSRVAPIQINYLGYPGSLGTNKLDYIIADKIVIPNGHEKFYSEKIIRMPNCYLCTDDKMKISKEAISRKDFNLPAKGFIFTCFNGLKKITPNEFDIWMRLLTKTKDSILWLRGSNSLAINNLRSEAEKRNVDKNRLIFAKDIPRDQHLARHSLGDLGLDTFAFNGCSTSVFGLWAGMPILTKIGESFAARFTASLLYSMGVNELITHSKDEYEEVALRLANDPNELLELKSKIRQSINSSPLFNSDLFTRDLETKYVELVNRNSF